MTKKLKRAEKYRVLIILSVWEKQVNNEWCDFSGVTSHNKIIKEELCKLNERVSGVKLNNKKIWIKRIKKIN